MGADSNITWRSPGISFALAFVGATLVITGFFWLQIVGGILFLGGFALPIVSSQIPRTSRVGSRSTVASPPPSSIEPPDQPRDSSFNLEEQFDLPPVAHEQGVMPNRPYANQPPLSQTAERIPDLKYIADSERRLEWSKGRIDVVLNEILQRQLTPQSFDETRFREGPVAFLQNLPHNAESDAMELVADIVSQFQFNPSEPRSMVIAHVDTPFFPTLFLVIARWVDAFADSTEEQRNGATLIYRSFAHLLSVRFAADQIYGENRSVTVTSAYWSETIETRVLALYAHFARRLG